jgi:hypothetical protein
MVWYNLALKPMERPKSSQPREQQSGPRPELPLREVYKLPSQLILDGIYTGRIGNPEALRAYFIRQRTEFLQAHPDGEAALDRPGPIGRWHGLVHSDTVEEHASLASFAEGEVHRRTAGLSDTEAESPAHLQGVANIRRIADAWRQRATRTSEEKPQGKSVPLPKPPAALREITQAEPAQGRDYSRMQDYEVLDGINSGEFTETEAVHVYVRKSLDGLRELYQGDELQEREADYAEVVYGEPQAMIRFCLGRATEHLGDGAPTAAVNPGNYEVAARWYAMAGRFAQEAARDRRDEDPQVSEDE